MKFTFENKPFAKDVEWEGDTFKSYSIKIDDKWHGLKSQDKKFDFSQIRKGDTYEAEIRTNTKGYKELWILNPPKEKNVPTGLETPLNVNYNYSQHDIFAEKYDELIKILKGISENIELITADYKEKTEKPVTKNDKDLPF